MQKFSLALAIAGVAASHSDTHLSLSHAVPEPFRNSKIAFADESLLTRASRMLGSWMGYDKVIEWCTFNCECINVRL